MMESTFPYLKGKQQHGARVQNAYGAPLTWTVGCDPMSTVGTAVLIGVSTETLLSQHHKSTKKHDIMNHRHTYVTNLSREIDR
jgi:hypothetical protein